MKVASLVLVAAGVWVLAQPDEKEVPAETTPPAVTRPAPVPTAPVIVTPAPKETETQPAVVSDPFRGTS